MEVLSKENWMQRLADRKDASREAYRAMYSTWWEGIVTDPSCMLIPIDDHQVHRGDAVFEAMKMVNGRIYLATEHLDRLERSALAIGMKSPLSRLQMENILQATARASGLRDAAFRLFLGRGPGSFSPNPYDTLGTQFHVVVTDFKAFPGIKIQNGVTAGLSKIPAKESWLAQIKSCNYLQNVLMKKEAVDRGLDFTVGVDLRGNLTEGSTENLIVLSKDGELLRPEAAGILAGTTMLRAFELAASLRDQGLIQDLGEKAFTVRDLQEAREVMMVGTTLDVLPVSTFEGHVIGNGKPGPVAKALRELLIEDQISGQRSL